MRVTYDAETTTKNKGHPFTKANFMVSYSVKLDDSPPVFKYYTDPDFVSFLRECISKSTLLIGFNIKFDIHWLWRLGIEVPRGCRVFDCQLAEFILTGQKSSFQSLDECLADYGLPPKQDKVAEYWALGIDTPDIPYEILEEYNNLDTERTYQLYLEQVKLLESKQYKLVILSGADLLVLSKAERAGLKFDLQSCKEEREKYLQRVAEIEAGLGNYIPGDIPSLCAFNFDSGDQLSCLIYGGEFTYEYSLPVAAVYKSGPNKGQSYTKNKWYSHPVAFPQWFKPLEGTEVKKTAGKEGVKTRFYQVDDPTLRQLRSRSKEGKKLLELLDSRAKAIKVVEMMDTFLGLLDTYEWGEYIHGQFNQNVARTGRLSSSKPNMQNTPPEVDQLLISRYVN